MHYAKSWKAFKCCEFKNHDNKTKPTCCCCLLREVESAVSLLYVLVYLRVAVSMLVLVCDGMNYWVVANESSEVMLSLLDKH